jgi:predicted ATPase
VHIPFCAEHFERCQFVLALFHAQFAAKPERHQAEADFRAAVARARIMGAKMLELKAIMSLARLLDQQQRRDEARAMLAEIYNWFTEGFDTADLKDAKALLDELIALGVCAV